jgi:hypothetical protein
METLTALNEWLFIVVTFKCDFSGDIFLIQFLVWIHACMHACMACPPKKILCQTDNPFKAFESNHFIRLVANCVETHNNRIQWKCKKCNKLSKDAIYHLKTRKIVREREKERDVPFFCFWGLQIWDSEIVVDVAKFVCEEEVIFLPFIQ